MMPFAEEFIILSRTVSGQDGDGNDEYADTQEFVYGAFAPAGSTENVQGQLQVITHDTVYLNDGETAPGPQDQLIARGITRDIEGRPGVYANPFSGWRPGAVVKLKDVTG